MPNIVFPTSSSPGTRPQESGGRLINAFVEKAPVGAPSSTIIRRSPGLEFLANAAGFSHTRGFLNSGDDLLLWILDERIWSVDEDFVLVNIGQLEGEEPVTTARNNNATPQMVAVTEVGCFNLFEGSAPTSFADADLPATPTSVCFYEGYFVWSFASGAVYASDLNSVAVNALSFDTQQGSIVRRVVSFSGRLFAFTNKWTAVYRNAGTSPFPLAEEAIIPTGIIGTHAVAGWEPGWVDVLIWAGEDFNVYRLDGYTPVPISTNDVSRAIEKAVEAGLRNFIEAFVYMSGRNAFWVLNCPGLWTWEYNVSTNEWNERKSHNENNWKGMLSIHIFDQWLIGGNNGDLYRINDEIFQEGTEPLIWQVDSGVMSGFPIRTVIPRASFHITTGVGDFDGVSNPRVMISWSLDGGHTWGQPVQRRLGGPGETKSYPSIINSGLSRGHGVRYRLVVSDNVHVGLSGGIIESIPRGAQG